MRQAISRSLALGMSIAVAAVGISATIVAQDETTDDTGITTIASGLTNPRGFGWSPDGSLYLAQAGWGGDNHVAMVEGFTVDNGLTASVSMVADGCATPVAVGLPSALWEEAGWIWGAMDVAFLGDDAYALLSGAGPTWFSPSSASGVYRLNGDGTMTLVGNVSAWLPDNPPAEIPFDYSSDGSLFDLEAAGDALLLSEAVGGQLLRISPGGEITSVADLSAGHDVPTGIAVDAEGNAYVGHETAAPYVDGASKVVKVTPDGTVSDEWTGLTVVTDVALGPDGALYATELATGFSGETAMMPEGSGRIVRQTGPDTSEVVVSNLAYPVNIDFDPDGKLVIGGPAFGPDAGVGQGFLVSVDPAAAPISFAGFEPASAACA
jgi:hypothetical protein